MTDRYDELRAAAVDAVEQAEQMRHGHWNMSDATDLIDQQSETVLALLSERDSLLAALSERCAERDEARMRVKALEEALGPFALPVMSHHDAYDPFRGYFSVGHIRRAYTALNPQQEEAGTMAYEYVKRVYGVNPVVGQKARHTETGEMVTIMREAPSRAHYVRIKMGGGLVGFSHPTALDYEPKEPQHG